jgi:N-formylglutamate amidohydrolase
MIAAMTRAPLVLHRPATWATPLIFTSPHSGKSYPAELLAASALDAHAIRKSEDVMVDALIGGAFERGVAGLTCEMARAYIDVNRDPWELDPEMFADALPAHAQSQTARVAAGLGSIARLVGEGQEIYARKLTLADAEARIETVHRPYHAALGALIEEARAQFGVAVVIDWHSMPSAAGRMEAKRGRGKPDMVLGDRHGSACAKPLTQQVRRLLEGSGYTVALNTPYAGGYTTQAYGRPRDGVHALQVEIDRGLYLDEVALLPTEGFKRLKRDLDRLFDALIEADWVQALA